MLKSLTILFVALFSLSVLAYSFHHHNDLKDRPSCIYCKLAKDISSTEHIVTSLPDFPEPTIESFPLISHKVIHVCSLSLANPRAPPA